MTGCRVRVGTGITVYGCDRDEAELFERMAPTLGFLPTITDAPVSEATAGLARGSRCVSIGHRTPVTDATLLALRRAGVRYVSTRSIGCNHLDVEYAESLGLRVGTVAYSPDSVADFTLMLMLMALRHAKSLVRRTDAHDFRLGARGRELRDLTVGVVGVGHIGSAVVDRLRGFGCRILACDIRDRTGVGLVALEELLRCSDVVSLHVPLTPQTHHLLDRRRIDGMRPGALVVNTGRGALIETTALLDALEGGRLGGAALDVIEGEDGVFYADHRGAALPHPAMARLQQLPNVLISPHTAYYTDHALVDVVENTLVNCLHFERENHHA